MSFFKTYFLHFICNIFAFCAQHYNGEKIPLKPVFKPTVNVLPFAPDDPLAQPVIIAAAIHTAPAFFK